MAIVIVLVIAILSSPCLACDVTDVTGAFSPSKVQQCINQLKIKILDLDIKTSDLQITILHLQQEIDSLKLQNSLTPSLKKTK